MLKIISNKKYQELKDIENKYNLLIGQTITIWTGGRSRYKALLSLEKEELVHRLLDLNNICMQMHKEMLKNAKNKR